MSNKKKRESLSSIEEKYVEVRQLVANGRERGYLTYEEINEVLPDEVSSSTTSYLNFLAGSAHSLASTDDPRYAWIKDTWTSKDPRLPLFRPAA